jgi:uroporphyrinogen-III synthase
VFRSLWTHLPAEARTRLGHPAKLASISPVTTAAAREAGLEVTVEAASASADALIDAIVQWRVTRRGKGRIEDRESRIEDRG